MSAIAATKIHADSMAALADLRLTNGREHAVHVARFGVGDLDVATFERLLEHECEPLERTPLALREASLWQGMIVLHVFPTTAPLEGNEWGFIRRAVQAQHTAREPGREAHRAHAQSTLA